jgi:hypothetical protein
MSSHPVKLPSESFKSKAGITRRLQGILRKSPLGEGLYPVDSNLLHELIPYHPDAEVKIGIGIKRFYVGKNTGGTTSFYLERHNGTSTHFSFRKCIINGFTPPTIRDQNGA